MHIVVSIYAAAIAAFLIALLLTWWVRKIALLRGIIDRPNDRSSHSIPTPRGGGLAIVAAYTVSMVGLGFLEVVDSALVLALLGGGLAIAWVGFADDRRSVSVRLRFFVHAAASVLALYALDGLPPIQIGSRVFDLGIAGDIVAAVAIIWVLNLFNFMDGIDGIAASEAVFVSWGGSTLAFLAGFSPSIPAAGIVFGAACCGFLIWNWPPAKIFMGDAGSGFLGFVIAVLAIGSSRESSISVVVWLILGGVFFVDATITVMSRMIRGERVYEAHRTHAYQWLARRWGSHRRVTLIFAAINLLWLFPCAFLAAQYPQYGWGILLAALTPLIILAISSGAGRSEGTPEL